MSSAGDSRGRGLTLLCVFIAVSLVAGRSAPRDQPASSPSELQHRDPSAAAATLDDDQSSDGRSLWAMPLDAVALRMLTLRTSAAMAEEQLISAPVSTLLECGRGATKWPNSRRGRTVRQGRIPSSSLYTISSCARQP